MGFSASPIASTVHFQSLRKAITAASKNSALIADPVIMSILMADEAIGSFLGFLTQKVALLGLGGAKAASVAEGGAQAAVTDVTVTPITLTPARKEFARSLKDSERSQLAGLGMDDLPPDILDALVAESWDTWANTYIEAVLALANSATLSAGTTGTALSWATVQDLWLDAVNRGAVGPEGAILVLKVKGVKDLGDDALSLGGAIQMSSQVQQFLSVQGTGYIGTFFGGLRIYMADDVYVSAPDDLGLFLTSKGAKSAHKIVPLPDDAQILLQPGEGGGWISVEAKRATTTSADSRLETAFWFAVAIHDANAIVKVLYVSA